MSGGRSRVRYLVARSWRAVSQPKLLSSFILRKVEEFSLAVLWIAVSSIIRLISSHSTLDVSPILRKGTIDTVLFASPELGTNLLFPRHPSGKGLPKERQSYLGPNLAKSAMHWFSEVLGANVKECQAHLKTEMMQDGSTIFSTFVSTTPMGPSKIIYLIRIFLLGLFLRKRKIPVVLFLPDTYYPDAAIVSSVLAALTGGVTVFLQNTADEATTFGYPNAIGPVFWTRPAPRSLSAEKTLSWSTRKNRCIVPGGNTGGTRRLMFTKDFTEEIGNLDGWTTVVTDGSLRMEEYLKVMEQSKACMTTNFVQDNFYIGPKSYRKLITQLTTTGRVWDAFSAGQLLICNQTKVLDDLGFIPGLHYICLDSVLNRSLALSSFSDEAMERMAELGHSLFVDFSRDKGAFLAAVHKLHAP